MQIQLVLGFVCFTLSLQIRFCSASRKGSGLSPPGRPRPSNWRTNVGLGVCQARGHGIRTLQNKIIRTKDSIDNGACFADAIVVGSKDECSARCCSFSGDDCDGKCDTSIFVHDTDNDNGEEVNCFLFVCGDSEDCKFSYHSGYTTTMILRHQERTEQPSTTDGVKKTTTAPPIHTTHSTGSTTTAVWDLQSTTTKHEMHRPSPNQVLPIDEIYEEKDDESSYNHNSHGCGRFRFKCGSGECFKFSYICDGVIDCRDNSDETGCDYTSTAAPLISTASAHDSQVWPTRLYRTSTKARTQQVADMRTNSASVGQTSSVAGFSSPQVALGSKKDFLSKHVVAEENGENSERIVGNDQVSDASGSVSDGQIGYKVHPADIGLTKELHGKGQEKVNGPDEIQGDGLGLTDLQDDLNALSATGNDKGGGNPDEHDNENKYTGRKGGASNHKMEDQDKSGENVNDRNEDYESNGDEMWRYNDDKGTESQQLDQDFYGNKFEEEKHEENRKDEDSLKEIGREKEEKNMLDLEYDTYDTSVVDKGKHNGYGRLLNDGYKKEEITDSTRENPNAMQHITQDDPVNSRPVYEAVGRKLDNVPYLPHTRKNGHQTQFKNTKNEMNHQMKSSDHTVSRLESTQRSDKGAHAGLRPAVWQGRTEGVWDDKSFTSESSDADDIHDTDKGLVRDKGDKWLQQGPKTGAKNDGTYGGEYFNRDHDSVWHDTHVVSRNRNLGWPENIHEERQRNKMNDGHVPPNRPKSTGEAEYEPDQDIASQKFVSKWQDRQRRPDLAPNQVYLRKYNRQQKEPNWYNNPARKQEYRGYEDLGRGENAHQFWNQYKNQEIQHHRPGGNIAGSSQDYSANEYDTADSFDEDHEDINDINDITTTQPPDQDHKFEGMSSVIRTTTTKSSKNMSEIAITESSGNITEATKKASPNNSNKHGSSRKHLFKAKSPVTEKPLTSAILPLAFGLLITVLLLLLVGCRLRQVNRRLRYGRLKTNVAEADYLINGMYL